MNRAILTCIFLSFVFIDVDRIPGGDELAAPQQKARLSRPIQAELDYLLYLPKNYQDKSVWPLLLFLHGAGERGDDLELVKVHGPPKLINQGKQFPFIVVSPQCPKDLWWEPLVLNALIDEITAAHKVDESRVYVTGLSMGGFGTWSMAARFPDRIAAIAPICGGGERFRVRRFAHLPTWVFHGAKDTAVPIDLSQEMVDEMKKWKGDVQFTVYPDAGHDSWTETYDNPKFYEWLLEHRLGSLNRSTKNSDDQIEIRSRGDSAIAWVSSPSGMGRGSIERGEMTWPAEIAVRLRLKGLELFSISNGAETLKVSVLSGGDNMRLVHLWKDGREGPQLDESSMYWSDVQIVSGRGGAKIPLRDGFFEVPIPQALLVDNPKSLSLEWIDFYRR